MGIKKISFACYFVVYVLFLFCITFVAYQVCFNNTVYQYNTAGLVITAVAVFLLLYGLLRGLGEGSRKNGKPLLPVTGKYFLPLTAIYLFVLFFLHIIAGLKLRFIPAWDMGAIYNGAVEWIETGAIEMQKDYFYYFPNNLGSLLFLKCIFSFAKLIGVTDYFLVGVVTASVSVLIMMYSVIMICRKLLGTGYAVLSMVLMMLCLPFYFASAAFYTDVLSMYAPPLFYLIYIYSKEQDSIKKKLLFYFGMALVAASGMEIKFTVIIIVIAVGIDAILSEKFKSFCFFLVIQVVTIFTVFSLVNSCFYPGLLDKAQAEKQNTPLLHWVMMGAKGDGSYNPEDYEFTRSFQTKEERDAAVADETRRRYKGMGVEEKITLFKNKTIKDFGDGTYGLSDFLDDSPVNDTVLHKYVLYASPYYKEYSTVCQGVFILVLVLMLIGGACTFKRTFSRKKADTGLFVLALTFLGLWCFLMLWETSARYFSNYISIMLVTAVYGMGNTVPE